MSSVGTHIRRLRTARHMTQEQLAERLFVTRQAVSAWETGKALPDVETLERIAAALDAGVTEVIYGVPKTPDLKRQRRKWMAASAISAIISVLIIIILVDNGSYDTWQRGLIYQFHSTRYTLCQEKIPGTWSVELDLTDLESNAEKVLYEDESGCRITVERVEENPHGDLWVWFQSHGVYDRTGGTLVTACSPICDRLRIRYDKNNKTYFPEMSVIVNGINHPCTGAGGGSLNSRYGNRFGCGLSPWDKTVSPYQKLSIKGLDTITVSVSNLTRFSSHRIPPRILLPLPQLIQQNHIPELL